MANESRGERERRWLLRIIAGASVVTAITLVVLAVMLAIKSQTERIDRYYLVCPTVRTSAGSMLTTFYHQYLFDRKTGNLYIRNIFQDYHYGWGKGPHQWELISWLPGRGENDDTTVGEQNLKKSK